MFIETLESVLSFLPREILPIIIVSERAILNAGFRMLTPLHLSKLLNKNPLFSPNDELPAAGRGRCWTASAFFDFVESR